MIMGASILLVGMVIGYFLRPILGVKEEVVIDIAKNLFMSKKGIIVDLTPPPEIGEPIQDAETETVK